MLSSLTKLVEAQSNVSQEKNKDEIETILLSNFKVDPLNSDKLGLELSVFCQKATHMRTLSEKVLVYWLYDAISIVRDKVTCGFLNARPEISVVYVVLGGYQDFGNRFDTRHNT